VLAGVRFPIRRALRIAVLARTIEAVRGGEAKRLTYHQSRTFDFRLRRSCAGDAGGVEAFVCERREICC